MNNKPAFSNRNNFAGRGDANPFILSFKMVSAGFITAGAVAPFPFFGPSFMDSGYSDLYKNLSIVLPAASPAAGLAVGVDQIVPRIYDNNPSFPGSRDSVQYVVGQFIVDEAIAEISCVQNNIRDLFYMLRSNSLIVNKIKFEFPTLNGQFNDGINQLRQNFSFFYKSLDGRVDFQSVTLMDYYTPENRSRNADLAALITLDIPCDVVINSEVAFALNVWADNFQKVPQYFVHFFVEKYIQFDALNKK